MERRKRTKMRNFPHLLPGFSSRRRREKERTAVCVVREERRECREREKMT